MKEGELPTEPELQQTSQPKHKPKHKDWGESGGAKKVIESKTKPHPVEEDDAIEQDNFFGDDDDDDDEDS